MGQEIMKFIKQLLEAYSNEYKIRLEILYPDAYKENPEAFPFSDLSKLDAYFLETNEKLLSFKYWIVVYQGDGKIENLGKIDDVEYSKLINYDDNEKFVSSIINKKVKMNRKSYFSDVVLINNFFASKNISTTDNIIGIQIEFMGNLMTNQLKSDGECFRSHISQTSSYYAKDAFRFVYSELDFAPIIQAVNDPDFEYALNESIAAYDNSLYLAAVSTAGTALEALIIRILELENKPIKDDDSTELGELSGRLKNAGVIDKREKKRIMLAANFRNLASHSNKGRVIRQDAKLIYQEIFNLVSTYYQL